MAGRGIVPILMALGSVPAAGQSPLALSSTVETGWTSNATDSTAGGEDFYVSQHHEMTVSGGTDALVLRGTLSIEQTRFATMTFEDDAEVAGGVEARFALGADAVLRLGYAATQRWTGDVLMLADQVIPVRSAEAEHEYLAEFTLRGVDQQMVASIAGDWTMPGDSRLDGLGLPPLRLTPRVGLVTAHLGWERALSPQLAALTAMEARFTLIPDDDQLIYLRAPADGGRISAGLRVADGAWTAEARGGFDLVWPKGFSEMTRTMPYLSVTASVVPMGGVTLVANADTGIELADPVDGVAGRTLAAGLGATWQATPEISLQANAETQQEWGIFDESLVRSVHLAALTARYALSDRFSYQAALTWSRHADPGEAYDKAGLALTVLGAL